MNTFLVVALVCVASAACYKDDGYAFDVKHDYHGHGGSGSFGGELSGNGGGDSSSEGHHFPAYKYAYGVKDHHTGDIKDAWEHRHGDHVEGEYSFKEADGTQRIVKYHANGKEGFNAVVKNIGKPIEGGSGGQGNGNEGGYGGHSYQKVKFL